MWTFHYSARSSGSFEEENLNEVDEVTMTNCKQDTGKVQLKEEVCVSGVMKRNSLLSFTGGESGIQLKPNIPWRKDWTFDSHGNLQKPNQVDWDKDSGGISKVPVQTTNATKLDWKSDSGGISTIPVQPKHQINLDDGEIEVLLRKLISKISDLISIQTEEKRNEHPNDWHRGGMLDGAMRIISDMTQ
jgi:hypothetical protein